MNEATTEATNHPISHPDTHPATTSPQGSGAPTRRARERGTSQAGRPRAVLAVLGCLCPTTALFLTRNALVALTKLPYGYAAGDPISKPVRVARETGWTRLTDLAAHRPPAVMPGRRSGRRMP